MLNTAASITAEVHRQQSLSQQIAQIQTDISTEIKIHVASDDPAAAARIATIGRAQSDQTTYASNVNMASAISSRVDTNLASTTTALTRVKELMLSASNGTMNDTDRTAAITELQGLQQQIDGYAGATDANGTALFTKGAQPLQIPIGKGVTVAAGDSYDDVFGSVTTAGGTKSIDDIIGGAITALQTTDSTARDTATSTSLDEIDAAVNHIADASADIGIRENRISDASDELATQKTDLADERSGLENTDLTEAAAQLASKMTTLNAAQSVLAQLSKISLFNKLN